MTQKRTTVVKINGSGVHSIPLAELRWLVLESEMAPETAMVALTIDPYYNQFDVGGYTLSVEVPVE